MRPLLHLPFLLLFTTGLASPANASDYLGLNFGFALSKSVLGLSYTSDRNEINAGVKGFWAGSHGYGIEPGLTYNRYFTENGFYGSLSYVPYYRNEDVSYFRVTGPNPGDYTIEYHRESGWDPGTAGLGFGKVVQWTSWGIAIDANLLTPADQDFATAWRYTFGAGVSYRFRLD